MIATRKARAFRVFSARNGWEACVENLHGLHESAIAKLLIS